MFVRNLAVLRWYIFFSLMKYRLYCYIYPNESFTSVYSGEKWTPCPNGGFVYLYNADGSPHPLDRYFPVSSSEVIISSSQTANTLRPFSMVVPKERGRPLSESGGGTSPTRKKPLCVVCMSDAVSCIFFPCKRILITPFLYFASLIT